MTELFPFCYKNGILLVDITLYFRKQKGAFSVLLSKEVMSNRGAPFCYKII